MIDPFAQSPAGRVLSEIETGRNYLDWLRAQLAAHRVTVRDADPDPYGHLSDRSHRRADIRRR